MGRQAEAALRLFVADTNAGGGVRLGRAGAEVALDCIDDQSNPARCAEIYRTLVADNRADLLLGPYSSNLAARAAPIAETAARVFINHGGAADSLYDCGYKMIVGVPCPASEYLTGFVRLVASMKFWRKRMAIIATRTPFARAVAGGIERAAKDRVARRKGVRVRVKWNGKFDSIRTPDTLFPALRRNRVNALVSVGSYEHDLAVMRTATIDQRLNIPVLACVAAGVARFRDDLGESAEGIVGPSQWEPDAPISPSLGPKPREFAQRMLRDAGVAQPDYTAAQAYAAAMLAGAAIEAAGSLDQNRIRTAFSDLRATTMLGEFAIEPSSGRQIGHRPMLVQWHGGHKVIIEEEAGEDTGTLEIPAGWRLIAAGIERLRLNRGSDEDETKGDNGDERAGENGDKPGKDRRQIDERKKD